MEYTDFKRLIDILLVKNKETEWIEFKENFHSKEEIGERLSALSNSAFLCNMPYGYIVFGVNDDTLKVVGTDFYATLAILLEKVLPRVQGEQKQLETQNGKSNVLKDLKTFVESHFKPEEDTDANSLYTQVLKKLKEMDDKLANYYTNFF